MIHLPQEICDDIIDKIADDGLDADGAALLRQNLVCTLWTARAQRVLFRTLQIRFVLHNKSLTRPFEPDNTSFSIDAFRFPFYKGLRKRTHLLSYVKVLKIEFIPGPFAYKWLTRHIRYWKNERRLRCVLDVINSLRAVEQLEVNADLLAAYVSMPLLTKDFYSTLLSILHLPSLTTFRFVDGAVADLFALLRECPQITRLLVVGQIYGLEGANVATLVTPKLDSLVELVCSDQNFLRHLETLFPSQEMIKYGSLRCLHLGYAPAIRQDPHEESQWIAGVLCRLDRQLEHLSLCVYPIEPLWHLFDLSSLVYVELITYWHDQSSTWWMDWIIQSFSVPPALIKIQELKLSLTEHYTSVAVNNLQPLLPQWNAFDKSLASWPDLRRFILKLRPSCPRRAVIEAFPELERNSKLVLV
ncbi:hypothetical protein BDZ89DRAFT_1058560 [Hymenopellis radicata]|nr:hypothetical protein BDZ89DRAFT_1058560 [Hymenopellis radicata]